MFGGPVLGDLCPACGGQHVVDAECAAAHQLFDVRGVGEDVEVLQGAGVHQDVAAPPPAGQAVPLAGDLLAEHGGQRVDADGQPVGHHVLNVGGRAAEQGSRDAEGVEGEVEHVVDQRPQVPRGLPAAGRGHIGVLVAVELGQDAIFRIHPGFYLFLHPFGEFFGKIRRACLHLVDVHLEMLARRAPLEGAGCGVEQLVVAVDHRVDHRLCVAVEQPEVQHVALPEGLAELVAVHRDAGVLGLFRRVEGGRAPGIGHQQLIAPVPAQGDHQRLAGRIQLVDQLVPERRGGLAEVRLDVPGVILGAVLWPAVREGLDLAVPDGGRDQVDRAGKSQLPDAQLFFGQVEVGAADFAGCLRLPAVPLFPGHRRSPPLRT